MYTDVIEYWVNRGDFQPVFVVDSSNNGFPALEAKYSPHQLRVLKYEQYAELKKRNFETHQRVGRPEINYNSVIVDATFLERTELELASEAFAKELNSSRFVIKLTGKYRLPDLVAAMQAVPADAQAVIQHNNQDTEEGKVWCGFTCSELFALPPASLRAFADFIPAKLETNMEHYLGRFINATVPSAHVHRLPPLVVPQELRIPRTDNVYLSQL